jgi:hypothetical protein
MKLNIEKTQQMTLNPQIETIKNTEQLNYNDKGRIKCDMCEKTLINLRGYNIHRATTHKNQHPISKVSIDNQDLKVCDEYKYLGTKINNKMNWDTQWETIHKKN